jgi:PTH2 family peptidyl-tRNA hydrolase
MSEPHITDQTGVIITTSIVALFTGFLFGLHTARGYILPPELLETRRRTLRDPVESDADEVSEDESGLDHAPNWANGREADLRDGLRERGGARKSAAAAAAQAPAPARREPKENEECKLVLVVRTDLGMTKGECT